jgi:hypothetical protein
MNKLFTFLALFFLAAGASVQADLVISDLTSAEKTAILSDPNNEVVATAILQIEVSHDIAVGAGAVADDDTATVAWSRNQDHGFNLVYDGAGNYELTITPPSASPITVTTVPLLNPGTDYWNQLLFTITAKPNSFMTLDLSGNIDGNDFPDLQATAGTTDGLRFDFPNSVSTNVAEFSINGVFTPSKSINFFNGDFSGEFILVQNATVPEPSSSLLFLLAGGVSLLKRRRAGA